LCRLIGGTDFLEKLAYALMSSEQIETRSMPGLRTYLLPGKRKHKNLWGYQWLGGARRDWYWRARAVDAKETYILLDRFPCQGVRRTASP
jgi:hypothetical protein